MKTDITEIRGKIAELYPKRDRGDLREKDFQAELANQTVSLYRAIITKKMAEGETIECEHHTIWTHFRLMQSILREPAQQAISLFLTNKRLFRVQATIMPDQPPTADSRDRTSMDAVSLDRIRKLNKKFQFRHGEVLLGGGFCAIAVVFYDLLQFTGPILFILGLLGVFHGLALPTRWIEVETESRQGATDPIFIYALRKKSAKELVGRLQEKLRHSCPT
ncbi:MAG: hypothetical protein FJ118_20455 [Deltaproteobacteria bacterium]|nr:hypothetical protein [Deltaproteobacteria bacterium]